MFPDAFDFPVSVYKGPFAVLLVVQELSDVDPSIFELLLAMFLDNTILEASYHLSAVFESVTPVASEGTLFELTLIIISISILSHSIAFH